MIPDRLRPSRGKLPLPRIFEAIAAGDRDSMPRYEAQLAAAFDRAAGLLRQARGLLADAGAARTGRP